MINDTPSINVNNAQIYTDLNGVQQLKAQGKSDKTAALKNIAHQFESMMVQMMMKSMRDANAVFSDGDMTAGSDQKFYQDMFDNQLALNLSQGRGFGIADAVLRQLQGRAGNTAATQNPAEKTALQPLQRIAISSARTTNNALSSPFETSTSDNSAQEAIHQLFGDGVVLDGSVPVDADVTLDGSPQNFVEKLAPLAQRVGSNLGIDSRVLLSQSALETGWGQKVLQCADGSSSNNFFNIKADDNWTGAVVKVPVIEYQNGVAVREWANFRAYNSPEESFADYARLIANNPRYQQALQCADNPRAYVKALADAGYATDPRYAQKVLAVFDSEHVQGASVAR